MDLIMRDEELLLLFKKIIIGNWVLLLIGLVLIGFLVVVMLVV